jgi:acylphosphatase
MAKHLLITGRVQGVYYRASFEERAKALNLSGWVRNRVDGSVEAMVRGDADAIEKIIAWARRGPPAAQVHEVAVVEVNNDTVPPGSFAVVATT